MKMKNENKDLVRLQIKIIENEAPNNWNTHLFQEIALFVDKPEFLRLIDKIRDEYHIDKAIPADGDLADLLLLFDPCTDGLNINLKKYTSLNKFKELLPKEYANVMLFAKDSPGILRAQAEAVLVCFEFGRPFYFVPIVLQCIMYGIADPKWIAQTQAVVHDLDYSEYRLDEILIPQVVIELSPYSTDKAIKQAVQKGRRIFGTDPRFRYFNKQQPSYHGKIRKWRSWYWKHIKGSSYAKISDDWANSLLSDTDKSGCDENAILKGIQTYEKLLGLSMNFTHS